MKYTNQNGSQISTYVWEQEYTSYKVSLSLNRVELIYNIFNLKKFYSMFSQSSKNRSSQVV